MRSRERTVKLAVIHDFEIPEYRRSCKMFRNRYEIRGLNPSTGVAWNGGMGNTTLSRLNSIICRNSSIVEPFGCKNMGGIIQRRIEPKLRGGKWDE